MLICLPNTWGALFYKVEPQLSDFVVTKHRFSGLVRKDLALVLRSEGIETLLMTVFSPMCALKRQRKMALILTIALSSLRIAEAPFP